MPKAQGAGRGVRNQNTRAKAHKLKPHERYKSTVYEVVLVTEFTRVRKINATSEDQAISFAIERERNRKNIYGYSLGDIHVISASQVERDS